MRIQVWSFSANTGGPWALAQLAALLRDAGHEVIITLPGKVLPDSVDVVIAPEVAVSDLCRVRGPVRVLWWLSVDNAYWHPRRDQIYDQIGPRLMGLLDVAVRSRLHALLRAPQQRDILHAAQSEYARMHIRKTLGLEPVLLTDFLTDLPALTAPAGHAARACSIAYNPAKGLPATERVMRALDGVVTFRPIKSLTHAQTVELLRSCLIYLDLGSHPGRDRLPREAAVAGCVLLVGNRGAAVNAIDMPIPGACKLPVPWRFERPDPVARRIREIVADPQAHLASMQQIVAAVQQQERAFRREVDELIMELERRVKMAS